MGRTPSPPATLVTNLGSPPSSGIVASCSGCRTRSPGTTSRPRRRLRRQALLPILREHRVELRRGRCGRQPDRRSQRTGRRAPGRRRQLRPGALHTSARALRRASTRRARASSSHRSRRRVLASTHGVQIYHPAPHDYHRWTHEGLELLFTVGGPWESVTVSAGAGTASALAMLLGTYLESALGKGVLARGPIWLLNTAASTAERRSAKLREPVLGSLIPNFHVLALA